MNVDDRFHARKLRETHGVDRVARAIRAVDDMDPFAPHVARKSRRVEWERDRPAEFSQQRLPSAVTKPGREVRGSQTHIGNLSKAVQSGCMPRAIACIARQVHGEPLAIQEPHQVGVDRGVRTEPVLRVEKQDVDLVSHLSEVSGREIVGEIVARARREGHSGQDRVLLGPCLLYTSRCV